LTVTPGQIGGAGLQGGVFNLVLGAIQLSRPKPRASSDNHIDSSPGDSSLVIETPAMTGVIRPVQSRKSSS
jgi:hypothetical protein